MKRLAGLAGLAALAVLVPTPPAAAYMVHVDGPLDVLRDAAQRWTFELVGGASVDSLAVLPQSSPISCGIQQVTSTTSQLVCDVSATGQPLEAALVTAPRTLFWDGTGVRELRGAATPESQKDFANALALTFPSELTTDISRRARSPSGAHLALQQRRESRKVHGATREVWIAEATTTAAPVKRMPPPVAIKTLAIFAPRLGPLLLCHVREQYVCLRMVDPASDPLASRDAPGPGGAPAPGPAAARPAKAPVATLTVARKLTRLKTSLTADKLAAKVTSTYGPALKRCYADARKSDPKAAGLLSLKLTVNAVGKTESINVKSFSPALTTCIQSLIPTWRFPIPLGEYGSPIAARYELDLKLALKR